MKNNFHIKVVRFYIIYLVSNEFLVIYLICILLFKFFIHISKIQATLCHQILIIYVLFTVDFSMSFGGEKPFSIENYNLERFNVFRK